MAPSRASTPQHKAKKRKRDTPFPVNPSESDVIQPGSTKDSQSPAFPLVAFFWPAKTSTSQWVILPIVLMVVGLFRWVTGFWGYSGFQTPPMHGDFEAQRHWMEITTGLPVSQWYFHDLEYWGLDYPPLTAYHSWICGKMGSFINPDWFALASSRGIESQLLKVYMRATVLVSEYISYIPAAVIFVRKLAEVRGVDSWESSIALVAILMQPATILIDHAHFQYNTVMLGFVLGSMGSVLANRFLWSCIFFAAALCFKQMSLYYAPAIFAFLLGNCILPRRNMTRFIAVATITLLSFAAFFIPLFLGAVYDHTRGISPTPFPSPVNPPILLFVIPNLPGSSSWRYQVIIQFSQVIQRLFPFERGIFEDKVANIWCAIHTFHKLHGYPKLQLTRLSFLSTVIAILPTCMTISLFPRRELFPWALASSAWGFFLCSFQVHEKTVLLPLMPMTFMLADSRGLSTEMRAWIGWANMLGVWTLFPLLKRDELRVPYFVLTLLWAYLLGLPPTSFSLYFGRQQKNAGLSWFATTVHLGFYAAMIVWHGLEAYVETPDEKPDLWVVLNVLIGAAGFFVCFVWCSWQLILRSGVMEDYFGVRLRLDAGKEKKKQ